MNSFKIGLLISFLSTFAFAANVSEFLGDYRLTKEQKEGKTFCFPRIKIESGKRELNLYRTDSGYGFADYPLYSGVVNGPKIPVSSSHGEALETSKGTQSVTLKNNTLTFIYSGVNSLVYIPVTRDSDEYAFTLTNDKRTLLATRTVFEGVAKFIGKKSVAKCTYSKE